MSEETFQYRLIEQIGRGSSGEVYLGEATSPALGERWPVALKVLDAPYPRISRHEASYLRELRVRGAVGPSDVIAIDALPGRSVLAMEHVPGADLLQIVQTLDERGEEPSIRALLQLGAAVFEILASVHGQPGPPLLHRSLTPSDIRLSVRGEVTIVDFAVHAAPTEHAQPFSAPEQRQGAIVHPPGDVYAAAAIFLWAMGVSDEDKQGIYAQASALVGSSPDAQRAAALLCAAVADDPRQRPDAGALAGALGEAARGEAGVNLPLLAARVVPLASAVEQAPLPSRPRGVRWFPVGWREFLVAAVLMLIPALLIVVFTTALVAALDLRKYLDRAPTDLPEETAPAPGGFRRPQTVP